VQADENLGLCQSPFSLISCLFHGVFLEWLFLDCPAMEVQTIANNALQQIHRHFMFGSELSNQLYVDPLLWPWRHV
jgi:hypothetical protein